MRRRESIGATAQVDATADDGEADDGSVSTTARADESDGEAEAVLSTSDRSGDDVRDAYAQLLAESMEGDVTRERVRDIGAENGYLGEAMGWDAREAGGGGEAAAENPCVPHPPSGLPLRSARCDAEEIARIL